MRLAMLRDRPLDFVRPDEALAESDFLGAGDLAPWLFRDAHEIGRVEQAVGHAGVKPGTAAPHDCDMEFAAFQMGPVDVGDFQFTAWQGLEVRDDIHDLRVIDRGR